MTREHLYPRIWRSQLCVATQRTANSDVLVGASDSSHVNTVPVLNKNDPLQEVRNWNIFALQFFTETFDHHLENTPVEHIDRAKVITGSEVVDFPTMRIARLLEELSMKCKESTDYEVEMKKWRDLCEKAEREVRALHEINMHLGRERNELRTESVELREDRDRYRTLQEQLVVASNDNIGRHKETTAMLQAEIVRLKDKLDRSESDVKLFRQCNANQALDIQKRKQDAATLRDELSAVNARNSVQAATIREYQRQEDAADAQPDAIQDLRRRVEKVERRLGEID